MKKFVRYLKIIFDIFLEKIPPIRAKEIEINRNEKKNCTYKLIEEENQYLLQHPKAKIKNALKRVESKIKILKIEKWLSVKNEALLDGCYVQNRSQKRRCKN